MFDGRQRSVRLCFSSGAWDTKQGFRTGQGTLQMRPHSCRVTAKSTGPEGPDSSPTCTVSSLWGRRPGTLSARDFGVRTCKMGVIKMPPAVSWLRVTEHTGLGALHSAWGVLSVQSMSWFLFFGFFFLLGGDVTLGKSLSLNFLSWRVVMSETG